MKNVKRKGPSWFTRAAKWARVLQAGPPPLRSLFL